jgi:hypothetical protein
VPPDFITTQYATKLDLSLDLGHRRDAHTAGRRANETAEEQLERSWSLDPDD